MNIEEYNQIENLSYDEYIAYLLNKYGPVPYDYYTPQYVKVKGNTRTADGLFIHHIKENEIANLSNEDIAKENDFEYQKAENLVYCDYLEHYLLHLLIAEEYGEGVGISGIVNFIEPELQNIYKGYQFTDWRANVANKVIDDKEVYDILHKRLEDYQETEDEKSVLKEHNIIVYAQLEEALERYDRALVVIGTGLGKTTTALEYLRRHNMRALALAPQSNVKEMWNRYDNIEAMTYQGFMTSYKNIDYSKYNILICDEAHHCAAPKWGEGIRYVLDNHIIPVIGLTATPQEKKSKQNFETSREFFQGHVCEGHDILSAIEQGIVHPFSYVQAIYDTESLRELEEDIDNMELRGRLDLEINNTPTMKEILLRHMPEGKRKGIIFVSEIEAISKAIDIFKDIFPNVEYRPIHSLMPGNEITENREWFENTDEGYLVSVNMVSEGSHFKGINTIIMFRRTQSKLLYMQQLGRIVVLTEKENPNGIVFDLVNNAYALSKQDNSFYEDLKVVLRKKEVERQEQQKEKKNIKSNQIIIQDYCEKINKVLNQLNKKISYKIYCFETNEIFNNAVEAAKKYKLSANHIYRCCQNKPKYNSAGGKHWCYLKDKDTYQIQENKSYKPIWCAETNKIYQTAVEAAQELELSNAQRKNICLVCSKQRETVGGYHFCYKDDIQRRLELTQYINQQPNKDKDHYTLEEINILKTYYPIEGIDIIKRLPNRSKSSIYTKVQKLNLKFNNTNIWTQEELDILNTYYSIEGLSIIKRLPNRTKESIAQKASELKLTINKGNKTLRQRQTSCCKKVRCKTTGEIFNSIAEAVRAYPQCQNIGNVCRKKRKTCGGKEWEFVEEE